MVIFGWGYTPWLVVVSLFWVLAERLRPERRAQSILRPQLGNDLFYLAFNGVWYGTLMGVAVRSPVRSQDKIRRHCRERRQSRRSRQ